MNGAIGRISTDVMNKIALLIFSIGITFSVILCASPVSPAQTSSFKLETDQAYDNYRVRIFRNKEEGNGYFEILQDGKTVYMQEGFRFRVGLVYTDAEFKEMGKNISNDLVAMGKDITGKAVPNLVVSEWTGGAHCCFKFHIFEIGKRFKKIAILDAGDGDGAHFENTKGNQKLVFVASDWTFAYWRTGFAQSPAPEVILVYQDNSYMLDFDLMRKPPPPEGVLMGAIKKIHENELWKEGEPPPELWGHMLDLIYSGNADTAWKFFERAWLPSVPGKREFRQDFQARLRESPYWKQIKEMNTK